VTASLTAQDILDDIEFELAQGAISRDDLGRGIVSVKEYQSKLRVDLLQPGQDEPALREALARQFQLNDMLLTLLQETAASVRELQVQARRSHRLSPPSGFTGAPATEAPGEVAPSLTADQWRETDSVQDAATASLEPELDLRPVTLPLIGALLQRLRHAAHSLVLFYVRKLAQEQEAVNRIYGDWFLYQDALHHHHAEEETRLRQRLAEVEEQLAQLENEQSG
jgi:hypothetical protein